MNLETELQKLIDWYEDRIDNCKPLGIGVSINELYRLLDIYLQEKYSIKIVNIKLKQQEKYFINQGWLYDIDQEWIYDNEFYFDTETKE